MFITFEGSEGCGKTTQITLLAEFLRQQGYRVLTTREPGGTPIGEQIRSVLVNMKNQDMNARSEILLFQASRAQLVEQVIRPHIAQGGIVLSDRYADSTLAYQGYGRGVDLTQLRALIAFATGGLQPDLTLLLDMDVQEGLSRRAKGGQVNRLDALDIAFYQRVSEGFRALASLEPARWAMVDASRSSEEVHLDIRHIVMRRMQHPNP
jgi:dTMP kinase